jgi:hypothetical protein
MKLMYSLTYIHTHTIFIKPRISAGVHLYGVKILRDQLEYVHPLIQLISLGAVLEYISICAASLHYITFTSDGVGECV